MPDPSPIWLSADLAQPRFCVIDGALVVQRPLVEQAYIVGATAAVLVLLGIGASGLPVLGVLVCVVLAVAVLALARILLRRVGKARRLLDAGGWHLGSGDVPWSEVQEIVMFRGRTPLPDFVRHDGGERTLLRDYLPEPLTRNVALRPATIDLFCHLQHDLAHDLGEEPVLVVVDLGANRARASFVHPCARCGHGGSIGHGGPSG